MIFWVLEITAAVRNCGSNLFLVQMLLPYSNIQCSGTLQSFLGSVFLVCLWKFLRKFCVNFWVVLMKTLNCWVPRCGCIPRTLWRVHLVVTRETKLMKCRKTFNAVQKVTEIHVLVVLDLLRGSMQKIWKFMWVIHIIQYYRVGFHMGKFFQVLQLSLAAFYLVKSPNSIQLSNRDSSKGSGPFIHVKALAQVYWYWTTAVPHYIRFK